jgi:hypothetical protein
MAQPNLAVVLGQKNVRLALLSFRLPLRRGRVLTCGLLALPGRASLLQAVHCTLALPLSFFSCTRLLSQQVLVGQQGLVQLTARSLRLIAPIHRLLSSPVGVLACQ